MLSSAPGGGKGGGKAKPQVLALLVLDEHVS